MNFDYKRFLPDPVAIRAASKYLAFGGAVFAIGLVWNFPLERISETFADRITQATGFRISVDSLDPALPFGFKADNVRIQGAWKDDLEFSRLKVTVSPLSFFTYPFRKSAALFVRAEKDSNHFTADLKTSPDSLSATVETDRWKIDRVFALGETNPMLSGVNLKVQGVAEGALDIAGKRDALQRGDLSQAEGKFTLTATKAVIEVPVFKDSGFVNQPLRFDKIEARGTMKDAKLTIESVSLMGPDLSGTANGSILVSPYFPRSQMQLEAKLKISDRAVELRQMVTNYGSFLNLRMDESGALALRVNGMLDRPEVSGF